MKARFQYPDMPALPPRPAFCAGIQAPVRKLSGSWRARAAEEAEFYAATAESANRAFETVTVPIDMATRCKDTPAYRERYVLQTEIALPEDMRGKNLWLYFEAVNGAAKVYVDGQPAAEHIGGFVAWAADITAHAAGKERVRLAVAVDETAERVSSFSHGGIIRDVWLYAFPDAYFTGLRARTRFDMRFCDAVLELRACIAGHADGARVHVGLRDQFGAQAAECSVAAEDASCFELAVPAPRKWDAEHPSLYMAEVSLVAPDGRILETICQQIGFRQIQRAGNLLLVNGKPVKLRGVCRHEVTALGHRVVSRDMAERDVMLFKEANCNYVRTSHYPPSECFLELCDRHGIYVEDELPHAFIARTLDYTQRDPAQTQRYLQSFADLYARDANHPSVLIWSLCNESFGGYNFDVLNRFVRATDPTRPTKFSYPMTMQAEHEPVDIWSIHYTNLDGDLGARLDNVSVPGAYGHDMPVLHDECVHVPCYNRGEHRRDPNVRAFWGESIKAFWDLAWETEGALGGAIWAGIDETDMNWGGRGRHEWGIIDAWRRRKPEHYMTRKAYSPVAVRNVENEPGGIRVTIENRYCHTDLCETWVEWRAEGEGGRLRLPEAAPRMSAPFLVPLRMPLRAGARLRLDFYDASGNHVDEYVHELPACDALPGGLEPFAPPAALAAQTPPSVAMAANGGARIVSCGCEYLFSGETGLIEEARVNGEPILVGGPVMNMPYYSLGEWRCKDFRAEPNGNFAHVTIRGEYAEACDVTFQLSIEPGGILRTRYTIGALKRNLPRMEKLRVGVDCGGLDELGVYYAVVPAADTLRWKRRGAWSVYPDDHIARNEGMAPRYAEPAAFGREPLLPWALDTKNYTLNGLYDPGYLGTNDFRSQKTEIMSAELYSEDGSACVAVMSDGSHSVRLETEEPAALLVAADDPRVRYCGAWYKSEDPRGGRFGAERLARERGACAELAFCGVGCVWYGPVDIHYGCARVWVDGALADSRIDARVDGVEFLGSAPGSDKKHGFPLFCVSGLTAGEHLLRIEVLGEHSAQSVDDYIAISHFRILDGTREAVRLIVNNAYNYPHIAWGCRSRPAIMPSDGFTACAEMRLLTRPNRQPQPGAYTRERKHLPIQAK